MSNCCANSASVFSPLTAAKATFVLKAGGWFRRLVMVSPVRHAYWPLSGRNSTYPDVQISRASSRAMSPIHPRAIDVGSKMHVAAVGPDRASEPVRTFGTFTDDLHRLADWFQECGIKTVAMESTGVYWIPVFEILEQRGFEVLLVNARDAKHVPGRTPHLSDAQWLQRLHEFGLLRASFLPKGEIAALRAYLRQRERLLELSASHIQHIQKALMQMNVQVHHVVSDIMG